MNQTQQKLDNIADGVAVARAHLRHAEKLKGKLEAEQADLKTIPADPQPGTTLANTKLRIEARIKKLSGEIAADLKVAEDFASGVTHLVDGELVPVNPEHAKPDSEGDNTGNAEPLNGEPEKPAETL